MWYWPTNLLGNNNAKTWNVLPAVLTAWSGLLSGGGNETQYSLYKQQAQSYIDTARDNAELIKQKGEIALRNLIHKDKLERGTDVAKVGASGGNLTGSNLDVLIQKEKIRKTDELTLKANYTNQAMLEMYRGYQQAGNTYGILYTKASGDKANVLGSLLKGLLTYVDLEVRDAKTQSQVNQYEATMRGIDEQKAKHLEAQYDRSDSAYIGEGDTDTQILFPSETGGSVFDINNSWDPFRDLG